MSNWKQNPIVGVVAVVVIIVAVAFTIKAMMPKKYYYTADFKCEKCEAVFAKKIYSGQPFPIECATCGEAAAYSAVKCMDCGEVFVIKPMMPEGIPELKEGEEPTPEMMAMMEDAMMPKCPKCQSINIGSVRDTKRPPLEE